MAADLEVSNPDRKQVSQKTSLTQMKKPTLKHQDKDEDDIDGEEIEAYQNPCFDLMLCSLISLTMCSNF